MPVDWMQQYQSGVDERQQREQGFADAGRANQKSNADAVLKNIDLEIAHRLNPDQPGTPLPGKEQEVAELRQHRATVQNYTNNLYNPNFNPQTGTVAATPMRKLGDMLHITHPSEVNKTAGQQMKDLQDISTKYGPAVTPGLEAEGQKQQMQQKVETVRGLLTKYNASPETIQDVTEGMLGGAKPANAKESWDVLQGKVDGEDVTYLKNKADGSIKDLTGNPVPADKLGHFVASPKGQPAKPNKAWGKDASGRVFMALLDPFTNKEVPNSRNFDVAPPTSLVSRLTSGFFHYVDENGNVHQVQETRVSTPTTGGGGTAKPTAGAGGGGTGKPAARPYAAFSGNTIVGNKGTKDLLDTKTSYQGALDRQSIMHDNLDNALKGDQQAMLSLLANHIGMTLGLQKGARINQAVWNEAIASTPWLQKIEAKWSSDGYLSGVTLAPEQMQQMVRLADERTDILKQHLQRVRDEIAQSQGQGQGGAGQPKKRHSIDKAMQLPINQGKTREQVKADLEAHGYEAY